MLYAPVFQPAVILAKLFAAFAFQLSCAKPAQLTSLGPLVNFLPLVAGPIFLFFPNLSQWFPVLHSRFPFELSTGDMPCNPESPSASPHEIEPPLPGLHAIQ